MVAITADLGEGTAGRWRYGSGLLLGRRQVLTAAHVVAGAREVWVRDFDRTLSRPANLDSALISDQRQLDLALFEVPDAACLPPSGGPVNRRHESAGATIERCAAVGFPNYQDYERDRRPTRGAVQITGSVSPVSSPGEGLLTFQVTATPRLLDPSTGAPSDTTPWSGI